MGFSGAMCEFARVYRYFTSDNKPGGFATLTFLYLSLNLV
jgi:hypothetical protein